MLHWFQRILLILATAFSLLLLMIAASGSSFAGCVGNTDCSRVLNSEWSHLGPAPVSLFALFLYLALFILSFVRKRYAEPLSITLSFVGLLAILWFVCLQLFVLKAICLLCMSAHLTGFLAIALGLYFSGRNPEPHPRRISFFARPALLGLLIFGGFTGLQSVLPQKSTYQSFEFSNDIAEVENPYSLPQVQTENPIPTRIEESISADPLDEKIPEIQELNRPVELKEIESPAAETKPLTPNSLYETTREEEQTPKREKKSEPKTLLIHGGQFNVSTASDPYLGNPGAEQFIISLYDYTCKHCHDTHRTIREILPELEFELTVFLLVVPLNRHCNPEVTQTPPPGRPLACEYARLALAVFHTDLEAFQKFDQWLFSKNSPVFSDFQTGPDKARTYAESLVGSKALQTALDSPLIEQNLQKNIALYAENCRKTGRVGLPQQLIGPTINMGSIEDSFDMRLLLYTHLPD